MFEALQQISTADLAGLPAAWLFVGLFFATFVSEDAACIAAGALVAGGEMSIGFAIMSCFLGILAGDLLLYWAGRIFGRKLLRSQVAERFISEKRFDHASRWLSDRGAGAIFVSRFITGLRLPTYLAAGILKTDFRKFAIYFALAAAIWTPLLVASVAYSKGLFGGSIILAAVCVFALLRTTMKLTSGRTRRLLVGRFRRITRWEFWPLAVFYFPVVVYILLLAIRHRSLTVFTCVNPAIPAGGFIGESKDEIYSRLGAAPENRAFLLPHRLIPGEHSYAERIEMATAFMGSYGLEFPIVLKPDAGERGKGVYIVRSRLELERALAQSKRDQLLQQFFDGGEASVFFFRRPGTNRGEIFSITEKVFPTVTGDGISTLEELILADARAVCLAEKYFEANHDRLTDVPRAGESVAIIDIGTHSRGAIFLDGENLRTPELESAIDAIFRRVDGFDFGRFDIRYASVDEFRSGENFKLIELNGVTSESTNIYDPRYSLIGAYRILFAQWRIAFEIGQENRRLGTRATSVLSLFRNFYFAN